MAHCKQQGVMKRHGKGSAKSLESKSAGALTFLDVRFGAFLQDKHESF